jgi:hypothetical protein
MHYDTKSMSDSNRCTVILKPDAAKLVKRHKATLLGRGFDLSSGQLFRLALRTFDSLSVRENDVCDVVGEDMRRRSAKR